MTTLYRAHTWKLDIVEFQAEKVTEKYYWQEDHTGFIGRYPLVSLINRVFKTKDEAIQWKLKHLKDERFKVSERLSELSADLEKFETTHNV